MKDQLTADDIRSLIQDEIAKKLKITLENTSYETIGVTIKVEYDGWTLCYETV